jgi:hypothetical protein
MTTIDAGLVSGPFYARGKNRIERTLSDPIQLSHEPIKCLSMEELFVDNSEPMCLSLPRQLFD